MIPLVFSQMQFTKISTDSDILGEILNFTIPAGSLSDTVSTDELIATDDVHEAEEVFILVLEIDDSGSVDLIFDDRGGILIFTIRDSNRKI